MNPPLFHPYYRCPEDFLATGHACGFTHLSSGAGRRHDDYVVPFLYALHGAPDGNVLVYQHTATYGELGTQSGEGERTYEGQAFDHYVTANQVCLCNAVSIEEALRQLTSMKSM